MSQEIQNIILVGYRATGKSTVGRQAAAEIGLRFVDLDEEITRAAGMSVAQLVAEHGWQQFRQLEKETLLDLSGQRGLLIATGGGAVLHQDIWPQVRAAGLVIWLTATEATICSRLAADSNSESQRPALTGADSMSEVSQVLRERIPLYQASAQAEVDTEEPLAQVVARVVELWQEMIA